MPIGKVVGRRLGMRKAFAILRSRAGERRARKGRMTRMRRSRMPMKRLNEHSYRRFCDALPVDITASTYSLGLVFKLDDVKGAADFSDLYDRFMLTTVVLRFKLVTNPDSTWILNANPSNGSALPTNWFPKLWYCPDYDDNASESLAVIKERAQTKCKVLRPNQIVKIVVKPAVTVQTYRTATSTGYAPKWKQWIDMANQDVPHYGLKFVVDCCGLDPNDTYPFKLEIDRQYYFTCKDVR
jgi:hypothetical protein